MTPRGGAADDAERRAEAERLARAAPMLRAEAALPTRIDRLKAYRTRTGSRLLQAIAAEAEARDHRPAHAPPAPFRPATPADVRAALAAAQAALDRLR